MKLYDRKGNSYTLTQNNFLASGGQGDIYRIKDGIVKVLRDKEFDKRHIAALANFSHPAAAMPKALLQDSSGKLRGLLLPYVSGKPLVALFPTGAWRKLGFRPKDAEAITDRLRDLYLAVHQKGWLIVDGNEYNVIVQKKKRTWQLVVIDTDSWYTGGATAQLAQMPSIVDHRLGRIGTESDWFAFAVTTFQLFVGLHPFRGKAPGYKPSELARRVKDGVSVFDPRVRMPAAARSLEQIPDALRKWYRAVFQDGLREPPPADFGAMQSALPHRLKAVATVGAVVVREKLPLPKIARIFGGGLLLTRDHHLINLAGGMRLSVATEVQQAVSGNGALLAVADGVLQCLDGCGELVQTITGASSYLRQGNALFALTDRELVRLAMMHLGKKSVVKRDQAVSLPSNVRWYPGIGLFEVFGKVFAIALKERGALGIVPLAELVGKRVAAAYGFESVAVALVPETGGFREYLFWWEDRGAYRFQKGHLLPAPEVVAAEFKPGVLARVVADGELLLSSANSERVLKAPVDSGMQLFGFADRLFAEQDGELFALRMRQ